ncbi:uncharacterized protein At3g27210 [Zea mays]|uniref:Uncharacterized protein n=1 Tax=Zea mays TaxID=4577 RepID=A0A1D6ECY9_MAIZE|nr:uncharacterized protein At3g27210 [Zea mays]ONM18166.1 hypothetical protein ZEAMMB73_Zm00001d004015 [Zea mays]|eukprot:XP_008669527.1 uncharacterized protein At3g27210 [Zea mays]
MPSAVAEPLPDGKYETDRAGAVTVVGAGADHSIDGAVNGSKDESFFEARPWLDSDSEDDFYSVRGDFTPSRGSTPVHPRLTPSSGRMLADRSGPSLVKKKQRLLELLQEEQHYDDEDDSVTDASNDLESSAVHAIEEEEEHTRTRRRSEKSKKSSGSGCLPTFIWKRSFTACRKKKKEKGAEG